MPEQSLIHKEAGKVTGLKPFVFGDSGIDWANSRTVGRLNRLRAHGFASRRFEDLMQLKFALERNGYTAELVPIPGQPKIYSHVIVSRSGTLLTEIQLKKLAKEIVV